MGWGASRGIWREGLKLREFAGKWFEVRRGEYRDGWSLSESDLKNIVGGLMVVAGNIARWFAVAGAFQRYGRCRGAV